ncbi:MAG TPA: energy transducer TonB, partial [Salinimicrobium sp.]|nr:energy transducer TonB [Salinimicrobium sp.]
MKKLFFIAFLMISSFGFAQEGVKAEGNTITVREIGPVWPGCEGTEEEISDCFSKKLSAHVAENYQYVKDSEGNYVRGKSTITFIVNK